MKKIVWLLCFTPLMLLSTPNFFLKNNTDTPIWYSIGSKSAGKGALNVLQESPLSLEPGKSTHATLALENYPEFIVVPQKNKPLTGDNMYYIMVNDVKRTKNKTLYLELIRISENPQDQYKEFNEKIMFGLGKYALVPLTPTKKGLFTSPVYEEKGQLPLPLKNNVAIQDLEFSKAIYTTKSQQKAAALRAPTQEPQKEIINLALQAIGGADKGSNKDGSPYAILGLTSDTPWKEVKVRYRLLEKAISNMIKPFTEKDIRGAQKIITIALQQIDEEPRRHIQEAESLIKTHQQNRLSKKDERAATGQIKNYPKNRRPTTHKLLGQIDEEIEEHPEGAA